MADYAPDGRYSREQPLALDRFNALGRWVECVPMLLVDGSQLACQEDSTAAGASGTESSPDDAPGTRRRLIRRWAVPPAPVSYTHLALPASGPGELLGVPGYLHNKPHYSTHADH